MSVLPILSERETYTGVPRLKVEETRKRSLLKGITFKILEIGIDGLVLWLLTDNPFTSLGIALFLELNCYFWYYVNERIWNKIQYGRIIKRTKVSSDRSIPSNPFSKFYGNLLTREEKELRLNLLQKEIDEGEVDEEIIPYLKKINSYPFIVTTQSCCGHNEDPIRGRRAHIDFRTSLSPEVVINCLLKPMDKKYSPHIGFQLLGLECDRLRYCMWLDNQNWREQLNYFIELLESLYEKEIKKEKR